MRKLPKSRPTIYSSNDFLEEQFKSVFFKQLKLFINQFKDKSIVSTLGQADVLKLIFEH
jgi:flagellar biosynthesis regulator FlbT